MDERRAFWEQPEIVQRFAAREADHRLLGLLEEIVGQRRDLAAFRVLDLGCAGGRNAVLLAERGFDVVAVDAARAMVEETRRRLTPVVGEEEAERRVWQGRMDDLGQVGDGSVDLIVALGIYHNAASREEWDRTLDESLRLLAPGGQVLVSVFTPRTDLTGKGVWPVAGEPHVYEGLPGGRAFLLEAAELDAEMAARGFEPVGETETVVKEVEPGRRVSANGLYVKRPTPATP